MPLGLPSASEFLNAGIGQKKIDEGSEDEDHGDRQRAETGAGREAREDAGRTIRAAGCEGARDIVC